MADVGTNRHGWSQARRAKQAEAIRSWQPWTRSTGPRTSEGKRRAAANGRRRRSAPATAFTARDLVKSLIVAGLLTADDFRTLAEFLNTRKGRR